VTGVVPSLDSKWFTDATLLARERTHVFAPHWHYIGAATAVADAGTYMAADLGGLPIVVTRDEEGVLRALANVCRHRGHVIAEGCGRRRTLQCPYHGWTYRLDGSLHRAPGAEVDPADGQLPAVAVETVGPLLFACADPAAAPLKGLLGPFLELVPQVSGLDLDRLELRRSILHEIDANWKIVAENFMECYHCPLVHGDTLPGYGDEEYVVQDHGTLVTHRLDRDRFSWANLFPNTQISAYGNHGVLIARQLVPDGPGRTRATLDYWFDPDVDAAAEAESVDWFERVVAEDVPLCNSVQVGCASGLLDRGLLHLEQESGPIRFEEMVVAALASG
jgi:phenylpropionate dioxygenase-like ring-hydroxylating dioxygenase large terminal subunit